MSPPLISDEDLHAYVDGALEGDRALAVRNVLAANTGLARSVALFQADKAMLKTIYAPLSNFFIWLVLGSSIAAVFGVEELTGRAINISTQNLRTIETFSVIAIIYIGLTFVASLALALVGRWAFRVKARIF